MDDYADCVFGIMLLLSRNYSLKSTDERASVDSPMVLQLTTIKSALLYQRTDNCLLKLCRDRSSR